MGPHDELQGILGYRAVSNAVLNEAARRFGVSIKGGHAYGFGRKSAGAVVADLSGQEVWLRVSGLIGTPNNPRREAEVNAEQLASVAIPKVHKTLEWIDDNVFWRASLQSLAPSPIVSPCCWLLPDTKPPLDSWFTDLHRAMAGMQAAAPRQHAVTPAHIKVSIAKAFGPRAPTEVVEWRVCHGDLHWSNLTAPRLMLLDWESWGLGPRGYDAARLITYAGHVPEVQRMLFVTFAEDLDTSSGQVALLYALALLKFEIANGIADPALSDSIDVLTRRVRRAVRFRRFGWLARAIGNVGRQISGRRA